ncbi:MAG: hypothetical protein KKE05_06330 [Nanoarchaeota archaeon]|nr:hypothetical protein [Nanoarchaeota archaeon]
MKPYVSRNDEGCIIFEWRDKDRRFGIAVEKELKESGWYYVDKDGTMESGELPAELLQYFKG